MQVKKPPVKNFQKLIDPEMCSPIMRLLFSAKAFFKRFQTAVEGFRKKLTR